ncbi:ABC transporter substrate-binding protein [Amaricoccus sp.]|uniref:ABC transporter substrate-binding protein n=1 Tax=Amaricoccus sp. TaxID=1872485 RepID=UPI002D060488|nr:ABC transporter substrate-binding protein [Amaricoccus sp.]HRW14084.1 ABC transporter substrate-binding protein [Amaricoccus sp.]
MTIRIDRRGVLAGAAAFGSLGALGIPAARAQDARIRLLWWGSQNRNERTAAVIDLFTGANPGVAVEGESAGWDAYWARLATQTAGGNAPDVMQMDYRYIFEYARRGVLLALDDAMADGALDLSGFSQEAIAGGQVDGKTYGVSLGANSSTMIVSQAAFEEAGVALPEKGITWDDFAARAAELTEKAGKRGFYGSADAGGLEPTFEGWLRQRGKALYDAESKLGFDAEDATAWFAMWQAMRESGACVPADLQALDQLNIETSMVSLGHAGVSFAHSNQIVGYQGMSQTPLVMVPYPIGGPDSKPGQYLKPSMFFSLSANSGVPAEAAGFVSFFVNDPAATEVLGVERGVPESAPVRESLKASLDALGQAQIDYIESLGDLAGPLPPPPPAGAGEIQFALKRINEEVGFGTPPEAGAEALISEATAILERG